MYDILIVWNETIRQLPLVPLILGSFAIPYLIAYLSFDPSTRWIRIGLWPLSVLCYAAGLGRVNEPLLDVRFAHQGVVSVFGTGLRYMLATTSPRIQPRPREPLLGRLRRTRAGKALDLHFSEQRRINIAHNPPLRRGRSYIRGLSLYIIRLVFTLVMFDLVTYPIVHFAPRSYGGVTITDHPSFVEWVKSLSIGLGVDWRVMWLVFAWGYMMGSVYGFELGSHVVSVVTIGTGYSLEEEWPRISDWWIFKPSSLNEFWGKRYHQVLRGPLLFWSEPFSSLPRSLHILVTFFMSTLFHLIIFYTLNNRLSIIPTTTFFMTQGLGCVFERYLLRQHGIRVRGPLGRLWMVGMLTITAIPVVNEHHEIGWAGAIRKGFTEDPNTSPVQWGLYLLGYPSLFDKDRVA